MQWLGKISRGSRDFSLSVLAPHDRIGWADTISFLVMLVAIAGFAHEYVNPLKSGIPAGIDVGNDLAFLGTLRSELLDSGRLLTWWNVAWDGIPLLGHPNSQFFFLPLVIPSLAFGTEAGSRIAYVLSLFVAGGGMYFLARLLGPRPIVAAWAGILFAIGGGLTARIYAGHLQKVLGMPLIPVVLACIVLAGRAGSQRNLALWALAAGLLHGLAFLAGDTYVPLFLLVAVPFILVVTSIQSGGVKQQQRLALGLSSWASGLVIATAGKLLATTTVLAGTIRIADPYVGSQDAHWAIVHLAFPFYAAVPGLEFFSYGPQQIKWGEGLWEFTQYMGVIAVLLAGLAAVVLLSRSKPAGLSLSGLPAKREITALLGLFVIGAFWLANAQWYSPVHWLFEAVSGLQNFRGPSRFLMVAAPGAVALSAVGLELALRSTAARTKLTIAALGIFGIASTWWVNDSWFKPVRWFCGGPPFLDDLPIAACSLIIAALAAGGMALAGVVFFRLPEQRRKNVFPLFIGLFAVVALGDVYHATQATPKVEEAPRSASIRGAIETIRNVDQGPFLVALGNFGFTRNSLARLEFADRGIPVSWPVSPLEPVHRQRHVLIDNTERIRYLVTPSEDRHRWRSIYHKATGPQDDIDDGVWEELADDGQVVTLRNTEAKGDAWLIEGGIVSPLNVADFSPGRFVVRTQAPEGAVLAVPANAFEGWKVSIDGGPFDSASEFDGWASVTTQAGDHTYELVYKQPNLGAILVLGALPWVILTVLIAWGIVKALGWRLPFPGQEG